VTGGNKSRSRLLRARIDQLGRGITDQDQRMRRREYGEGGTEIGGKVQVDGILPMYKRVEPVKEETSEDSVDEEEEERLATDIRNKDASRAKPAARNLKFM
jgi:hypothetical protein